MTTTLAALAASTAAGLTTQLVLSIEGYDHLITDGSVSAALTAWADTEITQGLGGLFVTSDFQQTLEPWTAFQQGSDLVFRVRKVAAADTFAEAVFASGAGVESPLTDPISGDDVTVTVKRADEFAASGNLFIGNECVAYSSRDTGSDVFTVAGRGMYAPFKANTETEQRFGHPHRTGSVNYGPNIEPLVTSVCRTWHGKWVGLWMHVRSGTTLNLKADALCLGAWQVAEYSDTAEGDTIFTCKHVLSVVADKVLLKDQFAAQVQDGVNLVAGMAFSFWDLIIGSAQLAATDLVVTTGASGANQIETGYHTAATLQAAINQWLKAEQVATRITGKYNLQIGATTPSGSRTAMTWSIAGAGNADCTWALLGPMNAMRYMGYDNASLLPDGRGATGSISYGKTNTLYAGTGTHPATASVGSPYRSMVWSQEDSGGSSISVTMTKGTFIDQLGTLPPVASSYITSGNVGIFLINGLLFVGNYTGPSITHLQLIRYGWNPPPYPTEIGSRVDTDQSAPIEVKQILIFEGTLEWFLPRLFASTGSLSYNHAVYDALGVGLAIPWELLGDAFTGSITGLEAAQSSNALTVIIDKPTKLTDLIANDMVARRAHLVWKQGGLRFTSWSTPSTARSIYTLTENDKAAPVDQKDAQRSVMMRSDQWLRNVIRLEYNRTIAGGTNEVYRSSVQFEDRASIDDLGGDERPVTLKLRNCTGEFATNGAAVLALAPALLAWMPFFSRPIDMMSRTMRLSLFEQITVGDIVTVTDEFVRDPATGARGLTAKPGIVVWTRHDWGGAEPTDPRRTRSRYGEMRVVFLAIDRVYAWSPACLVDDGAAGAGYNAGSKTLTVKQYEYADSLDGHADSSYFASTDAVTICELDPVNPAAPQTWNDVINGTPGATSVVLTTGLAGFDTAKKYRMVPRYYSSATATQKAKAFQADDADAKIQDVAPPAQYGADYYSPNGFTTNTAAVVPERYAAQSYGDGAPMDVGNEAGQIRMLNNLVDFKTAINSPSLGETLRSPAAVGSGYALMSIRPLFVGVQNIAGSRVRYLYVAPQFRSTDGTSVTVRVTLSRWPPFGSSLIDNVAPTPADSVSFTTSSTSMDIPSASVIDIANIPDGDGVAYLWVEANSIKCELRPGLAECRLGAQG